MSEFTDKLSNVLLKINVKTQEEQLFLFEKYFEEIVKANKTVNLTRILDEDDAIVKHFADSLLIFSFLNFKKGDRVLDIGTGAGFPGVPIKIFFKDIEMTVLDSTEKKINIVRTITNNIGIDVKCITGRAEVLAHDLSYREKFDVVVSRAVARLNVLLELCLPYVKTGGLFLAYKSQGVDEIKEASSALKELNARIEGVHNIAIEGIERSIIVVKKIGKNQKKYPRIFSKIKSKPL
ncbi:MAG: 16S rRNA (guanine(527)-N(7))-methyltransferase RsmG [Eubacteriales bacterium]